MTERDVFVGFVAVAVGLFMCGSAVANSPWFERFWLVRHLGHSFGSSWARGIGGLIGIGIATLGILLMLGWFSKSERSLPYLHAPAVGQNPPL